MTHFKKKSFPLKIQQKVAHQEQLLHNLEFVVARMPGFIYWKNIHSQYMGCNDNLAKISHLNDRSEIVGKTDCDFEWGANQAEQFIKDDQMIIRTKQTVTTEYELPIKRDDGNYLYVKTEKMPFFNQQHHVIGILAIAIDITDQKILERQLREQIKKTEIAYQAKTQFIENMEHDIRTPFCGIHGIADLLIRKETDPEKKSLLETISSSAKELYDYCNTILDFSTNELGYLPLLEKQFDIKKLVMSVVTLETSASEIKQLPLFFKYDEDIPSLLRGDDYRLKRILINLVSNAIKFTQTGNIEISVELAKKISKKRVILKFIVADTGIGIPEDKQHIIYEKLTKLTPSNKGLYKGLGLGLSTVKQFIEDMEGEINLSSTLGKGSTFTCMIPFKIPLLHQ